MNKLEKLQALRFDELQDRHKYQPKRKNPKDFNSKSGMVQKRVTLKFGVR